MVRIPGTTFTDEDPAWQWGTVKRKVRWASWLTSVSQAIWMVDAGLIDNLTILTEEVFTRKSKQHPDGYKVARVHAKITDDPDLLNRGMSSIGPRFHPGDEGYEDQGYNNEWTEGEFEEQIPAAAAVAALDDSDIAQELEQGSG